jgi:hypothetical protein
LAFVIVLYKAFPQLWTGSVILLFSSLAFCASPV